MRLSGSLHPVALADGSTDFVGHHLATEVVHDAMPHDVQKAPTPGAFLNSQASPLLVERWVWFESSSPRTWPLECVFQQWRYGPIRGHHWVVGAHCPYLAERSTGRDAVFHRDGRQQKSSPFLPAVHQLKAVTPITCCSLVCSEAS